jgi:hypothetical protein
MERVMSKLSQCLNPLYASVIAAGLVSVPALAQQPAINLEARVNAGTQAGSPDTGLLNQTLQPVGELTEGLAVQDSPVTGLQLGNDGNGLDQQTSESDDSSMQDADRREPGLNDPADSAENAFDDDSDSVEESFRSESESAEASLDDEADSAEQSFEDEAMSTEQSVENEF